MRRLAAIVLLGVGCGSRVHAPAIERFELVEYSALAGFAEDPLAEAMPALLATCAAVKALADDAPLDIATIGGRAGEWRPFCAALSDIGATDHDKLRAAIQSHLVPVAPPPHAQTAGHFTGYYEESLRGARKQGGAFQTPLYGPPRDLVQVKLADYDLGARTLWGRVENHRVVPHLSRAEILQGGLDSRADVLFWTDDPVRAFFAQIQGSAVVNFGDHQIRIGFAGKNGRPYTAIGREMVKENLLVTGDVSMQTIGAWLATNPARAAEVMNKNASYVFFEEQSGPGPRGSGGAVLTPGRSLAVDRDVVPLGLPLFVDTRVGDRPYRRLMVAADTGGGIRGVVRGDIFFGAGTEAAAAAGTLSAPGRWFLLLPISTAAREIQAR